MEGEGENLYGFLDSIGLQMYHDAIRNELKVRWSLVDMFTGPDGQSALTFNFHLQEVVTYMSISMTTVDTGNTHKSLMWQTEGAGSNRLRIIRIVSTRLTEVCNYCIG